MQPIVAFVNYCPALSLRRVGLHDGGNLFDVIDFANDEVTSQFLRRRRRILATGKQAIIHLIEATRKPNYVYVLVELLLALAVTIWIVHEPPPRVYFKRSNTPEPTSIAALRSINHLGIGRQCSLASVDSNAEWRILTGPDAFSISMPRPWRQIKLDTTTTLLTYPTATFSDRRDNYLKVSRVATGASGRTFVASSRPTDECEISNEKAGSVWLFYTFQIDANDARYSGYGDAVTSGGRRYKLEVNAWTKGYRDSLVTIAGRAVLNQ